MEMINQMIPDNKGRVYCRKLNKVVVFNNDFFLRNCKCPYFYGIGNSEAAIECKFDNGLKGLSIAIDKPEYFRTGGKYIEKK